MNSKLLEGRSVKFRQSLPLIILSAILVVMVVVFEMIVPGFVTSGAHFISLTRLAAFVGMCAIGQTLVVLQGGIDMSISSLIMLTNVVASQVVNLSMANVPKAILILLVICLVTGFVNGAIIHYLRIPALVATLSTGAILQGFAYIYTGGIPNGGMPNQIIAFVLNGLFGFINGPVVLWILFSIITIIALKKTRFGRGVYAIGSNRIAAANSGIKVGKITIASYMISSLMAGIVGFLFVGYTRIGYLNNGSTYAMDSLTAVVMGGTLVTGGKGGYGGTIVGLLIYICLDSFSKMLGLDEGLRRIIQGIIIIVLLLSVNRDKN